MMPRPPDTSTSLTWNVSLRASPRAVFELLSTGGGRECSWAESAPERNGAIFFSFPNGETLEAEIEESVPDSRYSIRYFGGTSVVFTIAERPGGGRVPASGIETTLTPVFNGMAEIRHLVVIDAPVDTVYRAITEQSGLAGWWTKETIAQPVVGSIAEFRFGDRYHDTMRIVALEERRRVEWECLEGDEEWVGTTFVFSLEPKGHQTTLRFSHGNWRSMSDFFAHCNYHWGFYMRSLKSFCESGTGEPFSEGD